MKAMNEQDYEDVGRAIAGAILEGGKSKAWALDLIRPLDFEATELEKWLTRYRRERYQAIRWQKDKVSNRRKKIARLQEQARQLLEQANLADD